MGKQSKHRAGLMLGRRDRNEAVTEVTNLIEEGSISDPALTTHTSNTNNPHSVTMVQVETGPDTKTSAYTVVAADQIILVDASSAAVTITLPAVASSDGVRVTIKKVDSTANAVTIDPDGSETIEQETTAVLSDRSSLTIVCDGTEWWII